MIYMNYTLDHMTPVDHMNYSPVQSASGVAVGWLNMKLHDQVARSWIFLFRVQVQAVKHTYCGIPQSRICVLLWQKP